MSTRANIIIKEGKQKIIFYQHSDGYPEGTMPTLNIFLKWLKDGKIRDNVMQAASWLTIIGALEYNTIPLCEFDTPSYDGGTAYAKVETIGTPADWKASAYEVTTGIHGDIQYLYVVDLKEKNIKCYEDWTETGVGTKEIELPKELVI